MFSNNRNILFKGIVLALCIISCVHLFFFPLFETNTNPNVIRTYLDLEQSLCVNDIRKKKPLKPGKCPENGIITVEQGGRLGNQIWEYTAVFALARETGLDPYIPRCIKLKLDSVFDKLSVPTLDEIGHCLVQRDFYVMTPEQSNIDYFLEAWNFTNQSVILPKYIMQPSLLLNWGQDIIHEFSIKKSLVEKSQKILHAAVKYVKTPVGTFIGVHVRRTDYISYVKRKYNSSTVDKSFFQSAMQLYESKFSNPIFIFVSDDAKWCWDNFNYKKNAYITGKHHSSSPGLDMTILANCNHTIYDYGTYGMWGAILAGGNAVHYSFKEEGPVFQTTALKNYRGR
uniref:L-Fucosyltransferase n=1 Tax=Diabrotica virgifera virgifera TaxID=50390 RepID=A0A6P7FBU9_DIAVI